MKLLKSAAFLIAVLLKILESQLLFLIRKMKINPISFSTFFLQEKADTHRILQGSEKNSEKPADISFDPHTK